MMRWAGESCGACDFTFANGAKYSGDYCELLSRERRSHAFTKYNLLVNSSGQSLEDGDEPEQDAVMDRETPVLDTQVLEDERDDALAPVRHVSCGMHRLALQLLNS